MARHRDEGLPLDPEAMNDLLSEDRRHRARLLEIEQANVADRPDLLMKESDFHLKQLTRIYTAVAERKLERDDSLTG